MEGTNAPFFPFLTVAAGCLVLLALRDQEARVLDRRRQGIAKELRPLAIHDTNVLDGTMITALSRTLSGWYFCESGRLLLTPQTRYFSFARQDLPSVTSSMPDDWDTPAVSLGKT